MKPRSFVCAGALMMLALRPVLAAMTPSVQIPPPQQVPSDNKMPVVAGVETPWNVRAIIDGLISDNEQFQPILSGLRPQEWAAKGASTVYIQQWQQAQQQLKDVLATSKMLSQKTDSLSLALDDYFRLEALEVTSRSLEEGIRHYADRVTADKLNTLIAHNFSSRERFRDYIQNLAGTVEQNFKVADAEAQRCRGMISKEPSAKKAKK